MDSVLRMLGGVKGFNETVILLNLPSELTSVTTELPCFFRLGLRNSSSAGMVVTVPVEPDFPGGWPW